METDNHISDDGSDEDLESISESVMEINEHDPEFEIEYVGAEASVDDRSEPIYLANPEEPMNEQNNIDSDSFPTFYEIVPTLQEMSSFVIAIALWRRVISLKNSSDFDSVTKNYKKEVEKLVFNLSKSHMIRKIVKSYSECVSREMDDWLNYYNFNIFSLRKFSSKVKLNVGHLLSCCWLPAGKIDHKASALNMLSDSKLTQVDKFKIMCKYCLEDDIKKSSTESLPLFFTSLINFNTNALVYYWLCYRDNTLDEIPRNHGESIASSMITASGVNSWWAIEYFWDQLSVDEQTSKFKKIVDQRPEFQKKLFFKMSELQKFQIISEMPLTIMKNFWEQSGQERFVVSIWIYIRNSITDGKFIGMMLKLASPNSSNTEEKCRCLLDIWNHCSDHFKKLTFQPVIMDQVIKFHTSNFDNHWWSGNIGFLIAYLSYASAELKKQILFDQVDRLVSIIHLSITDSLIKLCLPNPNDVTKFRKLVLESKVIRNKLGEKLCHNDFVSFNRFSDYFCPDSNTRSKYCSVVLEDVNFQIDPPDNVSEFIKVVEFIDENLQQNSPLEALKFRKRATFKFAYFCCELLSNDDKITEIIEAVTQFLDTEALAEFKLVALKRIQTLCHWWYKFKENAINKFLLWCCDNDGQRMKHFKKTLSIDDIFLYTWHAIMVKEVLRDDDVAVEILREVLQCLDKRLFWYFDGDVEEVKRFKLEKVYGYHDENPWMFLLYPDENTAFMRNTLPWFFDGDRDAITLFRNKDKRRGHLV